jgi:N utilization substance protein A
MFDLKVVNAVLDQFEEERGIPRAKLIEAIEAALASAWRREYGKREQVVRAHLDMATGTPTFEQVKEVVDETAVRMRGEEEKEEDVVPTEGEEEERLPLFDPEKHMMIEDARRIKRDVQLGDEITFPLETETDFGRVAAQTARQVIMQKIREAEKGAVLSEYAAREGGVVSGSVQRIERGAIYVELGRAVAVIPYEEQIRSERYRPGDRIRALLYKVDENSRGVFLRLSRSHPQFLVKLFEMEAPELASGTVEIKAIAREAGGRTKLAVVSHDPHVDPVGSLVGQRGVRVSTVTSELSGERIDIVEWREDAAEFIKDALSPAQVASVELHEGEHKAIATVAADQQSLAIGRGGQNVRLAAKLTGWNIDIVSMGGEALAESDGKEVEIADVKPESPEPTAQETEEGSAPSLEEEGSSEPKEEVPETGSEGGEKEVNEEKVVE